MIKAYKDVGVTKSADHAIVLMIVGHMKKIQIIEVIN